MTYVEISHWMLIRAYETPAHESTTLPHGFSVYTAERWTWCSSHLVPQLVVPNLHCVQNKQVQNTAARLVSRTRRFPCITPVLCDLHWLPVEQRIIFKILLTFKALDGLAPSYLSELISPRSQTRTLSFWYQPIFCRDRTADFPHGQSKKVLVGSNCVVKSNCWQ